MNIDRHLLDRYLKGKEERGDQEIILQWFSSIKSEPGLRKLYHKYWGDLPENPDIEGYDGRVILDRIYHQMRLEETTTSPGRRGMRRIVNIATKAAAVLFIPLITFTMIVRNNIIPKGKEVASSEIYSPLGTRTMFFLPDGSSGWLNGGSTLEFPSEFRGDSRTVFLRGEAYFDVQHDQKKPFVVSGDHLEVVALGTSFNVLAYPDEQTTSVTLVSGSVEVSGKQAGRIQQFGRLRPGQMCTYDPEASTYAITSVDTDKNTAWKEGKLVFRNEPLSGVVKRISRWYSVEITIKDDILNPYVYMATFQDETLDEILKLISLSAPIRYKDLGREIMEDQTFSKRRIELYYKPG